MKSSRLLDRRLGFSLASLGMLFGVVAPAAIPAFASASTMQSRSISMSSSAANEDAVTYKIAFTPTAAFRTIYVDFCSESPIVGDDCTAPGGFDISGGTPSWTSTNKPGGTLTPTMAAGQVKYVGTTNSSTTDPVELTVTGVHNPTSAGAFYARIYTYAASNTYNDETDPGADVLDEGGIALSATDTIGVTAAVRETMTFCVFGAGDSDTAPTTGCTDAAGSGDTPLAPSLTLGEGTPQALTSSALSTGKDYAQISTNAAHGAVVYMKNSNSCGGLMRQDAAGCDIAPANADGSGSADFAAGVASFGVKLGTPASATLVGGGSNTTATGTVTKNAKYAHYAMLGAAASTVSDASGTSLGQDVTSTYGGYLFGTNGAPISDQNVDLTFGASASNVTPAGIYKANINLIAVGTY